MRSLQLIICFLVALFLDWSSGYQYPRAEVEEEALSNALLKRAGFVGMRGKKSMGDDWEYIKRARNSGFMGMRGKKSMMGDEWREDPSAYVARLRSVNDYVQGKRAGFVGMRGKKSSPFSQYAVEPLQLSWSREDPEEE